MSRSNSTDGTSLAEAAVRIIRHVQLWMAKEIKGDPIGAFDSVKVSGKPMVWLDLYAEREAAHQLRLQFGENNIFVIGEESLRKNKGIDLSKETRLVALLDMVDGTDLLERNFSNWCSAMAFYQRGRILGAAVGLPMEAVYYATEDESNAYVVPAGTKVRRVVSGPSKTRSLANANVCYYGQKPKNFVAVSQLGSLQKTFIELAEKGSATRIYNLAGNPMMMRLIDGRKGRMDAVFDVHGQAPHDVVPGAYIAQKAGAKFGDLEGAPIDLAKSLERPASNRLTYILASTRGLQQELGKAMGKRSARTPRRGPRARHR